MEYGNQPRHCQSGLIRSGIAFVMTLVLSFTFTSYAVAKDGHKKKSLITSVAPLEEVEAQLVGINDMELPSDISHLTKKDQLAIKHIVLAAKEIHKVFLNQMNKNGAALSREIENNYDNTPEQAYWNFYQYNWSTWNPDGEPFINLDQPRPLGLMFYPEDMTVSEFEQWTTNHPEDKEAFEGFFTVIKRDGDQLVAVPYSEEYADQLVLPAKHLLKAAQLTSDAKLATYLRERAKAFSTNDYRPSDVAWLALDGDIEVTIGPYETYADELLGLKATFMAMVTLVDQEQTASLSFLQENTDYLLANMPTPDWPITVVPTGQTVTVTPENYSARGLSYQLKVVDELFSAGDYRQGATIGYFLPNDAAAPGAKLQLIANTSQAKIDNTLIPIANVLFLNSADAAKVSAGDFNDETVMHEFGHGFEPASVFGTSDAPNVSLQEHTTTISEATADLLGLEFKRLFIELGGANNPYANDSLDNAYHTQIASLFRSMRFGFGSSHARGSAIQVMYLLDPTIIESNSPVQPAINIDSNGKVTIISTERFQASTHRLAQLLLEVQLTGDKTKAERYRLDSIAAVEASANIQHAFANIDAEGIPNDFIKRYPGFDELNAGPKAKLQKID